MLGHHGQAEPKVGFYEQGLTDTAFAQQLGEHSIGGKEATPERLHREQAAGAGRVGHPPCLLLVQSERLLAQDVLAALESGEHDRFVLCVRGRDIDDVDGRIAHEVLVRAVPIRDVEAIPERVGALLRSRSDRDELSVVDQREPLCELCSDATRCRDAPSNRHARRP